MRGARPEERPSRPAPIQIWAHRTRLGVSSLAVLISTTACTKNGGPMEIFAPPPPPDIAYVSPDGGDAADGTEDAPFASLARALRTSRPRIVLLPGVFPEPEVAVSRAVLIEGSSAGRAVLDGHIFVSAPDVTLRGFDVTGGIASHLANRLTVKSASISAGAQDDALSLVSSTARLADVALGCGPETCLQATTATVVAERVDARAAPGSKRVLRVETSSATLRHWTVTGGSIVQLQASAGSHLTVRSSTLSDSQGNGLAALRDSNLDAYRVTVQRAQKIALLVQRAAARVRASRFGATPDLTVGIAGATVSIESSTITGSPEGALSLSRAFGIPAQVVLRDGVVDHGDRDGALVSGGTLRVLGARFVGRGEPGEGGDAIVVHGEDAHLDLRAGQIVRPRGFGIVLDADATATITATITEPGRGGVLADDVAVAPVQLTGLVVTGCRGGSGVVALRTPVVEVSGGAVRGCAEAGYLAGEGSRLRIEGARATGNQQYGFAAFGGATVTLERSEASGSRWAAFATCGDGARIEVGEDVNLVGKVVTCP